jgi:acid phosphatase (class A)
MARYQEALFAAITLAVLCGCAGQGGVTAERAGIPELRPGILQGYLPVDHPLDSLAFVPPPPAEGSAAQQFDDAVSGKARALHGSPRWQMAAVDANLYFPAAAQTFACALGAPIGERETPELYLLLRRTVADAGLATYPAKNGYQRRRPFLVNGEPTCTPAEEEMLRHDGSYPSGHAAIGWAWALILSQLAPERAEPILARGRAFGESRIVCNVHWYSDVVAGRLVGAAAVARLQTSAEFRAALAAAQEEVDRVRRKAVYDPGHCTAEAVIPLQLPM